MTAPEQKQLALFDDLAVPDNPRPPDPEPPEPGAQLDLFGDRMLLLASARSALADLDAAAARRTLRGALARYGHDAAMVSAIEELDHLAFQVEKAVRTHAASRPAALVALAHGIEPLRNGDARREPERAFPSQRLWEALLRRAATESIARFGDEALVGGLEPGWLLLCGGDLQAAGESFERAVRAARRPRFLALLGEQRRRSGDPTGARQLYLSALLADPYDVDFEAIGDPAVSALPGVARDHFEIAEEPLAWCAAVGVVTGALELGLFGAPEAAAPPPPAEGLLPARRDALARAAAFLLAFSRSRMRSVHGEAAVLDARRAMKALQPALFDAVMGRRR